MLPVDIPVASETIFPFMPSSSIRLKKCGNCKYGLNILYSWNASHTIKWRYYLDTGAYNLKGCISKRLKIRPQEVEEAVFKAMKERIENLEIAKKESRKPDSKTEKAKAEIIKLDEEIGKLMDRLAKADDVLFEYINKRVKELRIQKSSLEESLRTQTRKHRQIDTKPLAEPLKNWDNLTVREKHEVAMTMIDVIYVSDNKGIDIHFSI